MKVDASQEDGLTLVAENNDALNHYSVGCDCGESQSMISTRGSLIVQVCFSWYVESRLHVGNAATRQWLTKHNAPCSHL